MMVVDNVELEANDDQSYNSVDEYHNETQDLEVMDNLEIERLNAIVVLGTFLLLCLCFIIVIVIMNSVLYNIAQIMLNIMLR